MPFISVIIPSYNRAQLIGKTIQSILDQTFGDFELIIVDDGSTDDTDDIVKTFTDARVHYYKKANSERGATRNYGIKRAVGRYLTFIDSDDILYPDALRNAYDCLSGSGFPECFAQAFEVRDQTKGKLLQKATHLAVPTLNNEILNGNFLGCIGVFIRREVLDDLHFEEERKFSGTEDWLLWLQLSARYPFYFSNNVCACMIEHASRSVLGFPEDKLRFRAEHLKLKLLEDKVFFNRFGRKTVNRIYAHMLSYTSLHLAMSGKKRKAFYYLLLAARHHTSELLKRRTLGIFKTILLR